MGTSRSGSSRLRSAWMQLEEPLFSSEGVDENMTETSVAEEKWLFLDIGDRSATVLTENKIPMVMASIHMPYNAYGCAFPESFKDKVMELFDMPDGDLIESPTDVRNVYMLRSKHNVQLSSRDHIHPSAWESVKAVLMRFSSKLDTSFVVSCPHGRNSQPHTGEDSIHIRFWSIPSNYTRNRVSIGTAFGIGLSSAQCDGFAPTGSGIPIDDDDGNVVAEIVGNTIYVLFDLVHEPENVGPVMGEIMRRYTEIATLTPEELEKHFEELSKRQNNMVKRAYIRACGRRREARLRQFQDSIRAAESTINDFQRRLSVEVQRLRDHRAELKVLENMDDDTDYGAEFDKLLEVPEVEKVDVTDKISVTTKKVVITHEGREFTMGRFRIDFYLRDHIGVLRCHNLDTTFRGGDYYHPHIRSSGECCFGNMSEGIGQLIGEFQFSIATQMLIQFLHSYNPDDAYVPIEECTRR